MGLSVRDLAQHIDKHCRMVAESLIHLLEKRLVEPNFGTADEAIADLRQQIASGVYS